MAPSTQKALMLTEKFGSFLVSERSIPKPGPGEVLVKIKATSLNPGTWKAQKYGMFVESFPAVLGTSLAGDIVELGQGVTNFANGDKVFAKGELVNDKASFQQYALASVSTLAKIPSNISYDEASTFPVSVSAVYVGFYNQHPYGLGLTAPTSPKSHDIYAGIPIVILGGASSVGQHAIQFAKTSGFSPIITTASLKHIDYLQSMGASVVLDRNLPAAELSNEITKITTKPIATIFDAISSETTQQTGLDILAPGGKLVVVQTPTVKATENKSVILAVGISGLPQNTALFEKFYQDVISGLIENGHLKPNAVEVLPNGLEAIPDGLIRLQGDGVSRLQLIVHPEETP